MRLLIFFILFALPCSARDFRLWLHQSVSTHLCKDLQLECEVSARFDQNITRLYHSYAEVTLLHYLPQNQAIAFKYRESNKITMGAWKLENMPIFDYLKTWKRGTVEVIHRSRIAFHINEQNWSYRQRLWINLPSIHQSFRPYVSNEFFFRNLQLFTQNRFEAGLQYEVSKGNEFTVAYGLQNVRQQNQWLVSDILIIRSRFYF